MAERYAGAKDKSSLAPLMVVTPAAIASTVTADPTDHIVPATALVTQADLVVSGDKRHLLALASFQNIPIVSAAEAVRRITA